MTDQTIPADKVQKIAADLRNAMRRVEDGYQDGEFLMDMSGYIKDLEALLPAPPRPTLADMTPDERDECKGMQADLAQGDRVVILDGHLGLAGRVRVLEASLDTFRPTPGEVTPRPDLPRMEWPGTEKPAPALPAGWRLAKHQTRGPVIVTRPEPDDDGEVCYVAPAVGFMGYVCCFCDPGELTYLDQGADQ